MEKRKRNKERQGEQSERVIIITIVIIMLMYVVFVIVNIIDNNVLSLQVRISPLKKVFFALISNILHISNIVSLLAMLANVIGSWKNKSTRFMD